MIKKIIIMLLIFIASFIVQVAIVIGISHALELQKDNIPILVISSLPSCIIGSILFTGFIATIKYGSRY